MNRSAGNLVAVLTLLTLVSAGCQSASHTDRGTLFGGLLGAGTGAIIGDALGNTGAGAVIGTGVGALAGNAIGQDMDEMEAQNRAMIAAQLGREIRAGAVTIDDVVMMSQSGVDDELIVNHIRSNGMVNPPGTHDLITLNSQGVSTKVIKAMQEPPPAPRRETVIVERPAPRPVIVEEYHYGPGWYPPPRYVHRHHHPRRSGVTWGMSFNN